MSKPVKRWTVGVEDVEDIQAWLRRFSYLQTDHFSEGVLDLTTRDALRRLQDKHSLPLSGELDAGTLATINAPRCGLLDEITSSDGVQNYSLSGCYWLERDIFWTFQKFSANPNLTVDSELAAMRGAIAEWQRYVPRNLIESLGDPNAQIQVGFFTGDHGDGYPFDGPGNVLAHTFFPCGNVPIAGDLHFDDSENWQTNGSNIDLQTVALHELGHALGLQHSQDPNAVMFPTYAGLRRDLRIDDIRGVLNAYPITFTLLVHEQDVGDVTCPQNSFCGTRGLSRRIEGFSITIDTNVVGLSAIYRSHVQNIGDLPFVTAGQFSGTRGQSLRMEAIAIVLIGPRAPLYSVWYAGHEQDVGDIGPVRDGAWLGSMGQSRRLEALQIFVSANV